MAHPGDFGLTDPKMVGASEYAAIYETLVDALEGCEEDVADSPVDFTLAMLDEFVGHATAMRAQVQEHRLAGLPLEDRVNARIDALADAIRDMAR